MATVVANMSMSLDGFVADPFDEVGPLFDWYGNGDVPVTMPGDHRAARMSEASAAHFRGFLGNLGAIVAGRRLFDYAHGWDGAHPAGVPVFVVTHDPPAGQAPGFTFVTDGVESAVKQAAAVAGNRTVGIASPDVVRQCLDAGLLDVIAVDLVPVLLGKGIRFFDHLSSFPVTLDDPQVVQGTRVTHLTYPVRKTDPRAGDLDQSAVR